MASKIDRTYNEQIAQEALERAAQTSKRVAAYEKAEQKKLDEIDKKIKRMAAIVGCSPKEAQELLSIIRSIW